MQRDAVHNATSSDKIYCTEPDPDYLTDVAEVNRMPDNEVPHVLTVEELSAAVREAYQKHVHEFTLTSDSAHSTISKEPPLAKPKIALGQHMESKERKALNKELKINHKIGKDVLQKPELDKVLRDRREKERKKEWEEHKSLKERTSLELKLKERANKMKEEEERSKPVTEDAPEFTRVHRKITLKSSSDELA